jgi:dTDP-4-amino-4,6-dideoxygalactose transaminase
MVPPKSFTEPVYVTRPILPDMNAVRRELEAIWASKWLTNHGAKHNALQTSLQTTLKTPHVSVFNNGTLALLVALKTLDLPAGSEVITTPFTFPATPHCISWNGLRPVFCDISSKTMVIDADKIEALITPRTSAILGVHVYGFPCDVEQIQQIADRHRLKVIYDAAHAFGTEIDNRGIGNFGDISMFSFHATKLYHTMEGGCLAYRDAALEKRIYLLRNFGIESEESVLGVGINGKMNELQAAIGLLNLALYEGERLRRGKIRRLYEENLRHVPGLIFPGLRSGVTDSCEYCVLRVEKERFGMSRDELYENLKRYNVYTRKYFSPLCSDYLPYRRLATAAPEHLMVANRVKEEVLCLPFYGELAPEQVQSICGMIVYLHHFRT